MHNDEAYMLPHAPGEAVVLYRAEAPAPEASYGMAPVHPTLHAWASHWVPVATLVPKELPFDAQHDGLSRLEPSLVNWQVRVDLPCVTTDNGAPSNHTSNCSYAHHRTVGICLFPTHDEPVLGA